MAKMSKEERESFLARPHVGVIGIERSGRAPLTIPIWYGYEPGGEVKIWTGSTSMKAELLGDAGRFSLCAQSESLPYKYVMVEGPVTATRDCDLEDDARPIARRYLGTVMGDQYIEDGNAALGIVVTMRPTTWYSVDYAS